MCRFMYVHRCLCVGVSREVGGLCCVWFLRTHPPRSFDGASDQQAVLARGWAGQSESLGAAVSNPSTHTPSGFYLTLWIKLRSLC